MYLNRFNLIYMILFLFYCDFRYIKLCIFARNRNLLNSLRLFFFL